MTPRRKLDPILAQRMLSIQSRLGARFDILMAAAAPALAASKTTEEAKTIVQAIIDDMVGLLDAEEAALLGELLTTSKTMVH